eukprot:gene30167-35147_t
MHNSQAKGRGGVMAVSRKTLRHGAVLLLAAAVLLALTVFMYHSRGLPAAITINQPAVSTLAGQRTQAATGQATLDASQQTAGKKLDLSNHAVLRKKAERDLTQGLETVAMARSKQLLADLGYASKIGGTWASGLPHLDVKLKQTKRFWEAGAQLALAKVDVSAVQEAIKNLPENMWDDKEAGMSTAPPLS